MLPLRDVSRRPLRVPIVTGTIIAINIGAFVLEMNGGDPFIARWSVIPAEVTSGRHLETILTAMFLHAGWAHILGNMLFLWVFGPEIEDVMSRPRFLVFYLLGGLAATFAQIVISPDSTIPNLGASGAIAAVMGAFLITYPRDQIRTVLFLGWYVTVRLVPALVLVGVWFLTQVFSEVGALATVQTGGVAYAAHIGGFAFGAAAARIFESSARLASQRLGLDPGDY
jgi:membrane associated rhomboid family serine protease